MTDRRGWLERLSPLALLATIAVALAIPQPAALGFAAGGSERADGFVEVLAALPDRPVVLVAFDPDLGTYAEIRPTVRALLADLVDRGASLAFVSLTVEGRALATAELVRLRDAGAGGARLADLGFRIGAEAALLDFVRDPLGPMGATGTAADAIADDGLDAVDLALVVGGNDLGPRTWVEQARTRQPGLRLAAVAPTVLLPELTPYLASGQLVALIGTIADGVAYRSQLEAGQDPADRDRGAAAPVPFLAGMLIAIAVLVHAAGGAVPGALRALGRRG